MFYVMAGKNSIEQIPNWKEEDGELLINAPVEFNFTTNLAYMQRDKNECMYEIENELITCTITTGDEHTLVQVSSPDNRNLRVRFLAGTRPKTLEGKAAIVHYIRDWFDLDKDLTSFYKMAQHDPLLQQVIKGNYGLRIVGIPDLFEALCWGVLGQQINLAFAYRLKRQFVEKFGRSITYNGKPYWVFPSYEKVAKLQLADMSDIKMTVRKSEYIIGIAQSMANGDLSKEKLLQLNSFKKIEKELIKIRGVGPWTANYVLMRCLRYPTAFPIDDVGLINAIKHLKKMERKPSKEEILEAAIPWKNWEAYATFYLWRALY